MFYVEGGTVISLANETFKFNGQFVSVVTFIYLLWDRCVCFVCVRVGTCVCVCVRVRVRVCVCILARVYAVGWNNELSADNHLCI